MNQNDLKILAQLRSNARIALTKMSKKTGIPVSTIFDRMKQHEENIITKHTSLVDFSKLGFHAKAQLFIKVNREDRKNLQKHLFKHPSVNSMYQINNGYDFLVEGVFKQIKDMEAFKESLEDAFKIESTQIYYIVDDIKKEAFMTDIMLFNLMETAKESL